MRDQVPGSRKASGIGKGRYWVPPGEQSHEHPAIPTLLVDKDGARCLECHRCLTNGCLTAVSPTSQAGNTIRQVNAGARPSLAQSPRLLLNQLNDIDPVTPPL